MSSFLTTIRVICAAEPTLSDPARVQRWNSDLEFFAQELPERHIDLFFNLPEPEFRARMDTLKAEVARLQGYEILVSLVKILAAVGDSHTRLRVDDTGIFHAFAGELLDFVETHEVEKLAIDLRLNGGGNSMIARPLIEGLKQSEKVNREGRLFVIIGRRTYLSALLNSLDLRDETYALFVGEETGGKPNHFGEVGFFMLKGTPAIVTYSQKHFIRSSIDEPSLKPDIDVGLSFSDYKSCRDPVLEAVLDYEETLE